MQRFKTAITATMTVLLVTSAVVGAASTGTVSDAVASVSGQENSTATEDGTPTHQDAHTDNVTSGQVEAALGPFLDEIDVTERQRGAVLDRAERMRANGAAPARIIDATFHTLRERGIAGEELRENAWRLKLGLLLAQIDLTAEQRAEMVDLVEAQRADDADPTELRRIAGETLLEYGVERSEVREAWRNVRHVEFHLRMHRLQHRHERFHDRDGRDHPDGKPAWAHRVQHRYDLTDEQTGEIVREARAMREEGADREAIVEMVHRKLHEFRTAHRHAGLFEPHDRSTESDDERSDRREGDERTQTGGDDRTETGDDRQRTDP